jgi:hypothetical protein
MFTVATLVQQFITESSRTVSGNDRTMTIIEVVINWHDNTARIHRPFEMLAFNAKQIWSRSSISETAARLTHKYGYTLRHISLRIKCYLF